MKHLILYAHPHQDSFNHAILETVSSSLKSKGHEVVIRDLYQLNFQPVLTPEDTAAMKAGQTPTDIKVEQDYVTDADVITMIYPIWWTGLPAIIKGYIDRVFAYGFAYAYGATGIDKLLTGKKGLIINTYGTPEEYYESMGMNTALKLTATTGIYEFTGIESVGHLLFGGVPAVGEDQLKDILVQVKEKINSTF